MVRWQTLVALMAIGGLVCWISQERAGSSPVGAAADRGEVSVSDSEPVRLMLGPPAAGGEIPLLPADVGVIELGSEKRPAAGHVFKDSSLLLVGGVQPAEAGKEGGEPSLPERADVDAAPLEKKIVFSFSKTPWDVALTRFAELAELQLILQFKPPGTFDYTSAKAYTIPEALDILNEVLIAQGFVVLRTDRFLTLAALDQPLPINQVPVVAPEDLAKRGQNEFVTIVRRLKFADPTSVEPEIKRLLGPHGLMQVVPSLKMVRITEQVSRLAEAMPLIEELDKAAQPKPAAVAPPPAPKSRKTYALANLPPERAIAMAKSILQTTGMMEPGPDGKSVIAVLTDAEHSQVEPFWKEFDGSSTSHDGPVEKSFALKEARAEGVVSMLKGLYDEKKNDVSIAGDSAANLVVAKGPGLVVDEIGKLIEKLEVQAKENAPVQAVYRVQSDAKGLASQMSAAYPAKDYPGTSITLGEDGRSILVVATPTVQAKVKEAIVQLGQLASGEGGEKTEVIQLRHASAEKLATTLGTVFPKLTMGASFGAEGTSNAIVVHAPAGLIDSISQVIKGLDMEPSMMGLREKSEDIFEPKNEKAATLIKSAEALYPTSTNVVLALAGRGEKIIVSAPTALMEKVKGTLTLLDKAAEPTAKEIERVYTLRHASVPEMIQTLSVLFPSTDYKLRLVPDVRQGRLFVMTADESLHERLMEMINQLDVPSKDSETVEIYVPKNVPVGALLASLTKVFGTDPSKPTMEVQPDGKGIVIRATLELQKRISDLLAKLDVVPSDPDAVPIEDLYKVKFGKAADLAVALEKLYPPATSGVKIATEVGSNVLIITAPKEIQSRIMSLLEKIDVPGDAQMKIEIYSPRLVTPTAIGNLLASMKVDGVGTVVQSSDGKKLLVAASGRGHERLKGLIERLDAQDEASAPIRKTYSLENSTASAMTSMLTPLFPATGQTGATIVADPTGKQLVIQAPEKTHEAIAELIKQADVATPIEEFSIQAKSVPALSLYSQIYTIFGGMDGTRVTYDTGSNRVTVAATKTMKERILALAEKIDQPVDPASGRTRQIYKIKNIPSAWVYTALNVLFPNAETGVVLTYEASNQLVIATARADQHEQIKAEIAKLDVNPRADWVTKTFHATNVSGPDLYNYLNAQLTSVTEKTVLLGASSKEVVVSSRPELMPQVEELVKAFDVAGPADDRVRQVYRPQFANAGYLSVNLEKLFPKSKRAEIVYDPYSATVTVLAPKDVQEEIARAVADLDQNPKGKWVERNFAPTNVSARELLTLLTTALATETNKTLATTPDDKQLIAIAPPEVMERIERLVTLTDKPSEAEGDIVTKTYVLRYINYATAYFIVQQLFPPQTSSVKTYYDSSANSITIHGPPSVHERVAAMVESMDVDPNVGKIQKVFTPKNAGAAQIVTSLQAAIAGERGVSVSLGPQKQTIVVFAPTETMPRIEKYIETLDAPAATETVRQLYKINFGNASYLVATLQALYPPTQFPVILTADAVNNVLVVEAPAPIQAKLAELIKELDVESSGRSQVVYRLEHSRASGLLTSLTSLLSGTASTTVAGPDDKSVVVNALPAQHEKVKAFIQEFDKIENKQDPQNRVYNLRFATASNVARMVSQLYASEPKVRITYDDAQNTLLVTAPPLQLAGIEQVVNDADVDGIDKQLVSEVLRLKEGSANDVARALATAFPDRKQATFVPDGAAGTVFVRAVPRILEDVRKMVEQLDQPPETRSREVAVFDLFRMDPWEAQSVVSSLFEGNGRNDRPTFETTNDPPRLIVRGSGRQLEEVRTMLSRLEGNAAQGIDEPPKEGPADRPIERVIRLNNADADATIESLEKAWPLLRRNKLVVISRRGPLDGLKPEKLAIEQEKAPGEKEEAAPEAVEVEKEKPAGELPGDPEMTVHVVVGNDRLTASSRDIEALDLLQSLADAWTAPFDPDRSASRVFYIEYGDADQIAKAIDEAFNGKPRSEGQRQRFRPERVRVVSEPSAHALIVRASAVDLVNVKQLIERLDIPPASQKAQRIIPLKQAEATEVLSVVKEVFEDYLAPGSGPPLNLPGVRGGSGSRSRSPAMSVDIDPRSNSLVVSAPDTVLEDVEELVQGLEEAAGDSKKSYRVIPVENASPNDVRRALETLLDRQLSSSPGAGSSRSTPSRKTKTPRTRSSRSRTTSQTVPHEKSKLGTVHRQTNVATIKRGGPGSPAVDPNLVPASALDDELKESDLVNAGLQEPEEPAEAGAAEDGGEEMEGGEDGAGADGVVEGKSGLGAVSGAVDVSILDDVGAMLLLGSEKDLTILSGVIEEIEKIAKIGELSFEVFPLVHTKAAALADLLNEVYGRLLDARGGMTRSQAQATILPLAKPNALLLVAPKDEIRSLVDLAARFDVAVAPETEFKIFRLRHVRASVLGQTIESFYSGRRQDGDLALEVVVEADERSNSLVIYAGPRDIEEIAKLVEELDTSKTARVNELRIFYLKHTVSTELAATLQAAIQTGQFAPPPTAGGRSQPSIEITDPNSPDRRLGSGILESVTITPNRRANALIVSAPKDVLKLIESLITQLDVLPEAIAEIKVFTLVNSDATTMAATLRGLFSQLQSEQNRVAVSTGPDSESNPLVELTFSIDERTNSILVSGTKEQLEVVEAIVLRLDGSDIEERKTDVYRLKNAPADDVATALTELLSRQQQLQGVTEGQSVQQQLEQEVIVVPELISNSLLVSASPRYYERVVELIEKLDELPPQVVIQVLLAEVELDRDLEFGVELGLQDGILFQRSNLNNRIINSPTGTAIVGDGSTPGFNFNSGGPLGNNVFAPNSNNVAGQGLSNFALGRTNPALGFGGLVLSASSESVSILLRALARDRRLEVLSRPQIMTLDNQQASIVVGAEVARITGSNLVQGAGVSQNVQYVPTGVILEVTPKINPDGTVVMAVTPEVSRLAPANDPDANVQIGPGIVARALEITQANTTVSAQSGETVIIGGLIRKSTEREERKVPCLGDIPVVGHLFRYDRLSQRRSELIIILTPHVVRTREDAEQIKAMETARMNWCLSDVERLHGDLGLPTEVYLGDVPPGSEVIDVPAPEGESSPVMEESVPSDSTIMPETEEVIPQEAGSIDSSKKEKALPATATRHRVSKISISNKGPAAPVEAKGPKVGKEIEPPLERLPKEGGAKKEVDAKREAAKNARAERDKKIYQSPMDRRRDQFNAWKERNSPWKKPKKEEGVAAPASK
jgi:type II secretion system protein D